MTGTLTGAMLALAVNAEPVLRRNGNATLAGPSLTHWPAEAAASLDAMIAENANQSSKQRSSPFTSPVCGVVFPQGRLLTRTPDYAVFDMDNTSYRFDLEESLIPWLDNKGVLTRESLDPSLKPIPFKDNATHTESLYSYYLRLCDMDELLCYPWAAQVFAGLTLRELKGHVDDLMAHNGTVPVTYYEDDEVVSDAVSPPRVFRGQIELYNRLMANGIAVYVISAASEELVRMVASDPRYGYNVPAENVIGVTTFLRNTTTGDLTAARRQIEEGEYDEEANLDLVYTPYLFTPATWMAGKFAAILTYIDNWRMPVLVGGDTPNSDGPMQFHGADVSKGGVHLWVNRSASAWEEISEMIEDFAGQQADLGLEVTADKNWVVVLPEEIL